MGKNLHLFLAKQFANGKPSLFSAFHLIWIFIILLCTVIIVSSLWKYRKNPKTIFYFLLVIWIFMLIIESFKQFWGGSNLVGDKWFWKYDASRYLPFALCSMSIYFIPLYFATSKTKRIKIWILDFICLFNLYGGIFVLLYPAAVFEKNIFACYHTMLWHGSMAIIGLTLLFWRIVTLSWKSLFRAFNVFIIIWLIAGFANEITWQVSNAKNISEDKMVVFLEVSHRLKNYFLEMFSDMTNGKFTMSPTQFYFFYAFYTFVVINLFFWIFGGIAQFPYGIIKLNNYIKAKKLEKFELKRQEFAKNNYLNYV